MINSLAQFILSQKQHRVVCQTCQQEFVNLPADVFLKNHSSDPQKCDKWYLRVIEHFCLNPTHEIIAYNDLNPMFNFSVGFRDQCVMSSCTYQTLYQENLKWLEEAEREGRPI